MTVRGVELVLHPPGDYVSDAIRATGDFYEANILDELAMRIRGGVLVDVGAMIGNHTAYFGAFVRNDGIHAFEPLPSNAALLRKNAPTHGAWVYETALSDESRMGAMDVELRNLGHAWLADEGIAVRVRTLDSYRLSDVSLIKIDVEGHERQVLLGARHTIATWRPLIVIEDWQIEHGRFLGDLGYRLAAAWPDQQTYLYEGAP